MLAAPTLFPVTRPPTTVAIEAFEETHVTELVMSEVEPSE